MELTELKKIYSELNGKYSLPSFKELNEDFEIEKISSGSDTLLRAIRKVMMEKILSSLSFVELLLNPMASPRMYLAYVKSMSSEDRKCIEKIYDSFSEVSFVALDLEIDYSESSEAELVSRIFAVWQNAKPEFRIILKNMKNPSESFVKKDRSYFG